MTRPARKPRTTSRPSGVRRRADGASATPSSRLRASEAPASAALSASALRLLVVLATAQTADEAKHAALAARDLLANEAASFDPLVDALVHRANEVQALQQLAAVDPLTGAANRRAFMTALERELARAARGEQPVSVIMLDLDGLKAINDSLGHEAGDRAILATANRCAQVLRRSDLVARLGGDEFAVLLSGASLEQAQATAERLRGAVESVGDPCPLRISVGAAQAEANCNQAAPLLRAADAALYRNKRERRGPSWTDPRAPLESATGSSNNAAVPGRHSCRHAA